MNKDTVAIVAIAAGWAAAVGCVGLVAAFLVRRRSLRWAFLTVAVSAVLGLVAAVIGTARAMFLSSHDFAVMLWVSAAAGVVCLAFALLVARYAVQGSRAVEDAARAFGDTGRFVPPGGTPSELTALAQTIADASSRLAESHDRERALETSRRELVAWVSHDLRTPLAGLRAMAEALEDGIADDPARYHQQIRETVDRMAKLVDDLFELSRIHAGALQLSIEAVPLDEVISEALAVSAPVAQANGVRLGGEAEAGVMVRADSRELGRLIGNLVTNAIRHTPSEGVVEVSGRAGPQGVQLVVSDGCGGIPEDELPRVFDVAWQGTAARTPGGAAGSGLGLAIVRGIAEAHQGSVRVDNIAGGCRFLVELPAAPARRGRLGAGASAPAPVPPGGTAEP